MDELSMLWCVIMMTYSSHTYRNPPHTLAVVGRVATIVAARLRAVAADRHVAPGARAVAAAVEKEPFAVGADLQPLRRLHGHCLRHPHCRRDARFGAIAYQRAGHPRARRSRASVAA